MRKSTQELLEQLKKYPVFDLTKVARNVKTEEIYLKLLVHRLARKKVIQSIERNKYTMYKDPWVVASHLIWPSYISSWAALRYHNLTEQLPGTIEVVTSKKRRKRELSFQGMKIKFIITKPRLVFGFAKILSEEREIFVAEPEKALLDAALFKSMSFSEISEIVISNLPRLQKEKLIAYLIKVGNKSLIKRFGFVLDYAGKDYYGRLQKYVDHNYIALDYSLPRTGKKNIKWKVIDNVAKRRIS
ncbi:MAG: hypothetical protein KJ955_06795 [Nanoarchaeota archaeon]|nr:hypothetical protein [Nanoarchaeota archaeon]